MTGATAEELADFAQRGLLVPNVDRWPPWTKRDPYYAENQLEVLRWLVGARRRSQALQDASAQARELDSGAAGADRPPARGTDGCG